MRKMLIVLLAVLSIVPTVWAQPPTFTEELQPPASLPPDSRVWKDSTGKFEIAARIGGISGGIVELAKADGAKISVPLERLSEVDQIYSRQVTAPRVDPAGKVIIAKLVKVLDGDTVRVANALESVQTVRLNGVDAPENTQPHAEAAVRFLTRYVGQEVRVEFKESDRYKRLLGDVYCGGKWVNFDLVVHGLAWHYKDYSTDPRLAAAEEFAKSNSLHIWSDQERIAPWDFRNGVRAATAEPANVPSIRTTDTTVYITETGTHYHSAGCRHLSKSKIAIPLSRASAYTPCSQCHPPKN